MKMGKKIYRVVLTGGPASGKTTLISRILKEFKQDDGWRVITIPETATELISGFGINPFGVCMSMLKFQDFVIADQIHKEKLALQAAEVVPEEKVLIVYDRALLDDKAYITDEEFADTLYRVGGKTEAEVLAGYDAVLYLVTCAKGAEFAYNLGNTARSESIEYAREIDDRTLNAWSAYQNLHIIDNSVNFEDKINRAIREIYRVIGEPEPMVKKRKYLIAMPDRAAEVALPRRRHRHGADIPRNGEPGHRTPRPAAEKRRRGAVFLHREAFSPRRHEVGHRKADHRKGIRPLYARG